MPVKFIRVIIAVIGFILLGVGAVGVIIPVLPTTPFVMAAAGCFAASSKKCYDRLYGNRIFGQYIENYRNKKGISPKLKIASIAFLWAGLSISMIVSKLQWAYILLPIVGIGVTVHLIMIKTST